MLFIAHSLCKYFFPCDFKYICCNNIHQTLLKWFKNKKFKNMAHKKKAVPWQSVCRQIRDDEVPEYKRGATAVCAYICCELNALIYCKKYLVTPKINQLSSFLFSFLSFLISLNSIFSFSFLNSILDKK